MLFRDDVCLKNNKGSFESKTDGNMSKGGPQRSERADGKQLVATL